MAKCVHHPDKEAYKTCNYCHEPVCQDCIVEYSPKTQCKYCYADQTIYIAGTPMRNMLYAFRCIVIALIISCLVSVLMVTTSAHMKFLDGITFTVFFSSFVAISTLFQKYIKKRYTAPILFVTYFVCEELFGEKVLYDHLPIEILIIIAGVIVVIYNIKKYVSYKQHVSDVTLKMDEFVANFNKYTYKSIHDDHYDFDEDSQEDDSDYQQSKTNYNDDDQQFQDGLYFDDDQYENFWSPQQQNNSDQTDFFAGCNDLSSLKARYRSLSQLYHPDKQHGDNSLFQIINNQYIEKMSEYG